MLFCIQGVRCGRVLISNLFSNEKDSIKFDVSRMKERSAKYYTTRRGTFTITRWQLHSFDDFKASFCSLKFNHSKDGDKIEEVQ